MGVDLSKIQPGDVVVCRFTVEMTRFQWSGRKEFTAFSSAGSIDIPADAIIAHTPKALSVGDRVRVIGGGGAIATIKHIIDDAAWVEWDCHAQASSRMALFPHEVRSLRVLERA